MIEIQTFWPLLAAGNPVEHVIDKPWWGQWVFSNATFMLLVSAVVTALLIIPAARRIMTGEGKTLDDYRAKGAHANFVEFICLYLREEVFRPMLGKDTDRFMPMLWTFFWFILINNLLGLIPIADITAALRINPAIDPHTGQRVVEHGQQIYYGIGGTATQSIWVTAALAAISFLWYNGTALVRDPVGFFKHLTGGAPFYMWPIMVVVEIIGLFVKPFALALRLFANMTGGHIIVATLLGFVAQLSLWMAGVGHGLALLPLLGTIAVYFLELLVAFIQAFIFAFLTGLFLSQLVAHHEHGHEEEHGHAVAQGH